MAFCVLFVVRFLAQEQNFQLIQMIPENTTVWVEGTVCKKEFKKEDYIYYLKNVTIDNVAVKKICLRTDCEKYGIGDTISFQTSMRWMEQRRNTGAFDERQYYHSLGIATLLYCDDYPVVTDHRYCPVGNGLFKLRQSMREVYVEELNQKDAGILSSMVLGDKTLMEEELKSLYSLAGISHILAVSGLHVSMIGMTVFNFLRKSRRKYPMSCLVSGVCLMLFCIMSGMSISALRAGIMFLIYLGAQLLGRKYDSFRAMAVAAGITLIWNPAAIYNAGFWLSYMAVAGAVGIGRVFRFDMKAEKNVVSQLKKMRNSMLQSAWLSSSIMLTTLPLTAYFFYEIPLYGVLANLVILPLAGIVMGFGLVGGFLGLTGIPGMWVCFIPCHLVLRLYEGVCRAIALLPSTSFITGQPRLWVLFLYYGILLLSVFLFRNMTHFKKDWFQRKKFRVSVFPGMAIAFMVIMFVLPFPRHFQVSFLDVGQGDGIFVNGGDGYTYFIDGGSTSQDQLGKYQILPFLKANGIRKLDVWIVTHADQDHISGMIEVLESGYPVEMLLVSEHIVQDENSEALVQMAKTYGLEVVVAKNEDVIRGEDYQMCFFTPESTEKDRNQASLVTMLEYQDCSFLFTGDIGEEQETWLLEQSYISHTDILKAAHHGSKYSNSDVFLQKLKPELVIVSAGENNLYGHPHQDALNRMEAVGSQVFVTMDTGEVIVGEKRGKLFLQFLVNE